MSSGRRRPTVLSSRIDHAPQATTSASACARSLALHLPLLAGAPDPLYSETKGPAAQPGEKVVQPLGQHQGVDDLVRVGAPDGTRYPRQGGHQCSNLGRAQLHRLATEAAAIGGIAPSISERLLGLEHSQDAGLANQVGSTGFGEQRGECRLSLRGQGCQVPGVLFEDPLPACPTNRTSQGASAGR